MLSIQTEYVKRWKFLLTSDKEIDRDETLDICALYNIPQDIFK